MTNFRGAKNGKDVVDKVSSNSDHRRNTSKIDSINKFKNVTK